MKTLSINNTITTFKSLPSRRNMQDGDIKAHDEYFRRINEILKYTGQILSDVAKLDKRTYEKALILIKKGADYEEAIDIAKLSDKEYARALYLIRYGIDSINATRIAVNDDEFKRVTSYINNGASISTAANLIQYDENTPKIQDIAELNKEGLNYVDADLCSTYPRNYSNYIIHKNQRYKNSTAATLAHLPIEDLDEKGVANFAKIIETVEKYSNKREGLSHSLHRFIKSFSPLRYNFEDGLKRFDLEGFCTYLDTIDFKKLRAQVPQMYSYSSAQLLWFLKTHFKNGTTEFTRENLTFDDLTSYLRQTPTHQEKMDEILSAYPFTKREVGEIPADWLDKVEDKELAQKEIHLAIREFQRNRDTKTFSTNLSEILNKEVKVSRLSRGMYGTGYKIELDGAQTCCIKIFDSKNSQTYNQYNGIHYEPQAGLFLNSHDNRFVKMHFGKVADSKTRDGFLVTQFLDWDIKPQETQVTTSDDIYIEVEDTNIFNQINGKIIDFGGVQIYQKVSMEDFFA